MRYLRLLLLAVILIFVYPATVFGKVVVVEEDHGQALVVLRVEEQDFLDRTNALRTENSMQSLSPQFQAQELARWRVWELADWQPSWEEFKSHRSRTGLRVGQMLGLFQLPAYGGENLVRWECVCTGAVQALFDALAASPGHRKNMLYPEWTHVGLSIHSANGHTYGAQHFVRVE